MKAKLQHAKNVNLDHLAQVKAEPNVMHALHKRLQGLLEIQIVCCVPTLFLGHPYVPYARQGIIIRRMEESDVLPAAQEHPIIGITF